MKFENKRSKPTLSHKTQKYFLPITIILSVLISASVGYATSQIAIQNSPDDLSEVDLMKKQITEVRVEALTAIEAEMPKIISDLDNYNQDINLINDNISWLKESLAPIRDSAGVIDISMTVVEGVNAFTKIPHLENYITDIKFANIKLDEVDDMLIRLENLALIQQEISNSNDSLKLLFEEYQKSDSVEQLLLIEQELNSNLIYHIEDLRTLTLEAHEVFELSSSILTTLNQAQSALNFISETGKSTLDIVQFWKDDKQVSEIEENINEDLESDLATSKKELQNLPDKIAQQSKDSMTSISKIQKELQIIKTAEMIIGE